MHVLGLPPAFVLSQDQTLKLKVWILVGLEESLQGLLRNGHLHTLTHTDCSACVMVMAETQLSPESVLDHEPIFQSSGSARTPPSAFPFLQNHLSKSKTATKTAHRPQSDRLQRQRRSTLGIPGGNHVLSERAMPVTGRRSTECLATRIELISSRPACQRSPCKKFTVAQFSYV